MLKNYKILMVIIFLSMTGIITVISIWLYGSYCYRLDVVVTEVERSLSGAVQSFYHQNSDRIKQRNRGNYHRFLRADFIKILSKEYKNIDSIKVQQILDSLEEDRFVRRNREVVKEGFPANRSIVPAFVLEQIEFDDSTLVSLDSLLNISLVEKGIDFEVDVVLQQLPTKDYKKFRTKGVQDSLGLITTRPILVNSVQGEYLRARFETPVYYVIGKIFWHLVIVILLIFGLVGTFTYLFWTINRQNKMALLRKSFVNNMTHELKTPVSIVTAGLESVMRYAGRGDIGKMEKYLLISQQELAYLTNMIDKVLQLNIDEAKGFILDLQKTNVNHLIDEVIELSKLASSKPISVNFNSDEDIYLRIDRTQFKSVLSNLFDNAVKYANDTVHVTVELYKEKHNVVLKISDQGIGIPNQYLEDIFEMFFRVPNGDIYSVKGFGLGLAHVKQIVKQHGGFIEVQSELGKGTQFIIRIPNLVS